MKTMTLAMTLLIGAPVALFADVSKEDLKKLCAAGISDDVILSYVKSNGPLARLSADDVLELRQAGASESLLAAVLAVPSSAPSPVYAPPSTTYVYTATPSYTPSVVCDDYYPAAYYSYAGYCAPSFSLGYYGSWHCGGTYPSYPTYGAYGTTYNTCGGSRFVGGVSTYGTRGPVGGHVRFGAGHAGGSFGGGSHCGGGSHVGGGGHGGHR